MNTLRELGISIGDKVTLLDSDEKPIPNKEGNKLGLFEYRGIDMNNGRFAFKEVESGSMATLQGGSFIMVPE